MEQFRVIRHVTVSLGRVLQQQVSESLGRPIEVRHVYTPDARQGPEHLTLIHCALDKVQSSLDRQYERYEGGERFRSGPLDVTSRFFISAWATPPDDLDLLGAALRTFHDINVLEPMDHEEATFLYDGPPEIKQVQLSLAEHKLLADGYGMPLAPSTCYTISYRIQSVQTSQIKRVRERVLDFRQIDG